MKKIRIDKLNFFIQTLFQNNIAYPTLNTNPIGHRTIKRWGNLDFIWNDATCKPLDKKNQ